MGRREGGILGSREVAPPAAEPVQFETCALAVRDLAGSAYVLALYLGQVKEPEASAAALVLHRELDRQAELLGLFVESPDPVSEGRADG